MSDEETKTDAKKQREPKKNSIPTDEVTALIEGIPSYKKTSFLVVGYKDGVRLAIPLTTGVSRVYFYGNNDYSLIPDHTAITQYTAEQRREQRRGGIMAEVDFEKGLDLAREAFALLVAVVKSAQAPQPKLAKPKLPKKEKAVAPAKASADAEQQDGQAEDDAGAAGVDAHGGSDSV